MTTEVHDLMSRFISLRDALDLHVQGTVPSPLTLAQHNALPAVDLVVTEDEVLVRMALPGGNPSNMTISVTGDTLVMSGTVTRDQGETTTHTYLQEIWQGTFHRSLILPVHVESGGSQSSFLDGVLTLRLPKTEFEKRHTICLGGQPQPVVSHIDHASDNGEHTETGDTPPHKDALHFEPALLMTTEVLS